MSSIVVVCTGNICRSPVGEAVLESMLPGSVSVSSAGTHAAVGREAAPETQQFLTRELGSPLNHVARQLTKQRAEEVDLIITMTAEHRAWVARKAPRAVRRTFTLGELDEILPHIPQKQHFLSLRDIALYASRLRARVIGADAARLDIADPYGGPQEAYECSFTTVLASSQRVAKSLAHFISEP